MAKHPTTARSHETITAAADADTASGALSAANVTTGPESATPEPAKSKLTLEQRVARLEELFRAQGHNLD